MNTTNTTEKTNTPVDRPRYFVDMLVGGQLYAVSTRDDNGQPWTKQKARNEAQRLNSRKYQQLDQPKSLFQVRESLLQEQTSTRQKQRKEPTQMNTQNTRQTAASQSTLERLQISEKPTPMKAKDEKTATEICGSHWKRELQEQFTIAEKLSKGEITHTPGVWQAIAGSLRDELDTTAAERDKLREQVKELLAACKTLSDFSYTDFAAKWSEQSALQELVAIKRKARRAISSVEADKQGGQQ